MVEWQTSDKEGREHSLDGKPSSYFPVCDICRWKHHGYWHRETGRDWTGPNGRITWSLYDMGLEGRLLLW